MITLSISKFLLTHLKLLKIDDRNQSGFLLSPTHEEEITSLVSRRVKSYKALPLRLYQISWSFKVQGLPDCSLTIISKKIP